MAKLEVSIGKLENIFGRVPLCAEEALSRICNPDVSEIERGCACRPGKRMMRLKGGDCLSAWALRVGRCL